MLPTPRMLLSCNPRTDEPVGEVAAADSAAVATAVRGVRAAAPAWAALDTAARRRNLDRWRRIMARRSGELRRLLAEEAGKAPADALLEFDLVLHHLQWAAANARRVLAPRRVGSGSMMLGHRSTLIRRPYGVVGVIGPWNYPVYTPMGSIAYALATGNAVVFKPSEYTPLTGAWLAETFAEAVPDHPVLVCVHGGGETGAALVAAGVDKLAFTGSAGTGRKVMAACAESLTPVLMELGGKDSAIVDADADLEAAADAIVWGGLMNSGQTCAGVERVYVVGDVYDRMLALIADRAEKLTAGVEYGAIAMPGQIDVIARHIDAALADGGRAVVGGRESVRPPFVDPVVLADVPETSEAVQSETFGPVLVVNRVTDLQEAIDRTNASRYALGAAVFGKRRARWAASRLRGGMVAVNGVVDFGAVPGLPFGGNGASGFGRIHGIPGLEEFTTCTSITEKRFRLPIRPQRFGRNALDLRALELLLMRHRRGRG
ncbi:aldehyde dehydrogenase [Rhodococcus rhodnii LMG 5362]|uniref:Aldehyde dehydrogenase n=2 Tax=Rhodococcus rhodnii TaxID=38312 RepID=R7WSL2_9NOCA|nr:aldehyde dehydrogenase [Rhodococcus rhodnii LMG 5362]